MSVIYEDNFDLWQNCKRSPIAWDHPADEEYRDEQRDDESAIHDNTG